MSFSRSILLQCAGARDSTIRDASTRGLVSLSGRLRHPKALCRVHIQVFARLTRNASTKHSPPVRVPLFKDRLTRGALKPTASQKPKSANDKGASDLAAYDSQDKPGEEHKP